MTTVSEKDEKVSVVEKWSYTDEKIRLGLMVDQVKKGNRLTLLSQTRHGVKLWLNFEKK